MNLLKSLAYCACAVLLVCGTGCRGSGKPKVAFVTNNPEAFWNIVEAGATKAADENGVELLFLKPNPGNATVQKEMIDSARGRGVKAIAVSVIDPKNQTDYLNEIAGKVHLLAVDNDAPKSNRLAYLGTDNYQAGRAAGKLVKEALGPDGGTVMIFVGQLDALNARQRRQGVIDEVAGRKDQTDFLLDDPNKEHKFGKYVIYGRTFLDQPEGAKQAKVNAEEAIKDMPKSGNVCMVGLWAYNPPMILSAVKDKLKDRPADRKRVSIVGFDEDSTTLQGVRSGEIYATVVQDPYNFGYESIKLMAALAKGDKSGVPADGMKYIPYRVITQKADDTQEPKRISVDTFEPELNKLLGK